MGNYLLLLVQSGRSASATICLLLSIPAVSCFSLVCWICIILYKTILSDISADPDGRHQSATVRPRWSSLCWCFFFHVLAQSFYVEGTEKLILWMLHFMLIVRSGGIHAGFFLFRCCAVCKPGAKLHQNKTDTKRTVHRMYMWRGNWARMWSDCQEVPFFWAFLHLARKTYNTRNPKTRTVDNLSLISRRGRRLLFCGVGGILSTAVRAHRRHVP